jgi:hypothetical protein
MTTHMNFFVFFLLLLCFPSERLGLGARSRCLYLLNQADVIALQEDAADFLARVLLQKNLFGIVQNEIHVLVEADDVTFDACRRLFVEPDLNARSILQVAKDQVDRLHHHLLNLRLRTT